jgi:hypothetical protein
MKIVRSLAIVGLLSGITATAVVAPSASAAPAAKCTGARKGRIVGDQVCAVKNGRYQWVKVVPPADSPPPVGEPSTLKYAWPVATGPFEPAGYETYSDTSELRAWAMSVPSTWSSETFDVGGSNAFSGDKYAYYKIRVYSGVTLGSPSDYLQTTLNEKSTGYVIDSSEVTTIAGLPAFRLTYHFAEYPSTMETQWVVYRNVPKGTLNPALYIYANWDSKKPEAAARIEQMKTILKTLKIS